MTKKNEILMDLEAIEAYKSTGNLPKDLLALFDREYDRLKQLLECSNK